MKKVKTLFIATLALAAIACVEPENASRVLEDAGYTNIVTGGYDGGLHCNSPAATKFTATGPTGRPVSGVVCNHLPGYTISLN
jgi:hypothetical protein